MADQPRSGSEPKVVGGMGFPSREPPADVNNKQAVPGASVNDRDAAPGDNINDKDAPGDIVNDKVAAPGDSVIKKDAAPATTTRMLLIMVLRWSSSG